MGCNPLPIAANRRCEFLSPVVFKVIQISSHSCPCQSKPRACEAGIGSDAVRSLRALVIDDPSACAPALVMMSQLQYLLSHSSDSEVCCACADRRAAHSHSITAILCCVKKFCRLFDQKEFNNTFKRMCQNGIYEGYT